MQGMNPIIQMELEKKAWLEQMVSTQNTPVTQRLIEKVVRRTFRKNIVRPTISAYDPARQHDHDRHIGLPEATSDSIDVPSGSHYPTFNPAREENYVDEVGFTGEPKNVLQDLHRQRSGGY